MRKIHHAEMTQLIRREREIKDRLDELQKEFGTWKDRVQLARDTGRDELAVAAAERVDNLRDEARDLQRELKLIVAKKRLVRKESRRPTGEEVRRAEALLESFRQSGLIDPEEAQMEAEFDELRKHDPGDVTPADMSAKDKREERPPQQATDSDGVASDGAPTIDDLDLADLENLDVDELERLLASEIDPGTDD